MAADSFKTLFDAVADAVAAVDDRGEIRFANARAIALGLTVGGKFHDVAEPVEDRRTEVELDGEVLVVHALRRLSADPASRLRRELLPTLAHELRTPLNTIIGFTELIHKGKVGTILPEQEEYMGDVLTSARSLLRLLNDLLDLARSEPNADSKLVEVGLEALAREVCELVRGQAALRQQRLEVAVAPRVQTMIADVPRLKRILYELVASAVRLAPDGAVIPVTARAVEDPTLVRIDVDDLYSAILPRVARTR